VARLIEKIHSLKNGSRAIGVRADLRLPASTDMIIDKIAELDGPKLDTGKRRIDILVNNAGVEPVKHLGMITPEDFETVYNLNVRATLLMTQAVLPNLPKGARIINISSVGARCGFAGLSVYCSSKAAIEGLTRCWAAELGGNGATVNCVNPGPVKTALMETILKDLVERQKDSTPIEKRLGTVDDIARIVSWLAGDDSQWITG
jgi:3-oxoacyl-[acyl-carrier protein] reductase